MRDREELRAAGYLVRIAVPNGFAKDWLESRYRSLISQTLARIVGYSVQVEFTNGSATSRLLPRPARGCQLLSGGVPPSAFSSADSTK